MGWQATGWAFKSPIENPGCKFVLVALAERAGNEGDDRGPWYCHPSINTISEYTAQGYRTIQRHLDWLEAQRFISRVRRMQSKDRKGAFDFTLNPDQCQNGMWPIGAPEPVSNGQTEPVIGTSQSPSLRTREPFDDFWTIWPRKVAKEEARKAWKQMISEINMITLAVLLEKAQAYADHVVDYEERGILHAATWLRGKRWNDELEDRTNGNSARAPGRADPAAQRSQARIDSMVEGARIASDLLKRRRWTFD